MKRIHKKVLGLFGLSVVVAMTVTAILIPGPLASAITTVTDHLELRVLSERTDVEISGITSGGTYVHPKKFTVRYETAETVEVVVQYRDADNVLHEKVIDSFSPTPSDGEKEYDIFGADRALLGEGFGYGAYTIVARSTSETGVVDEDLVAFNYIPVVAEVVEDEATGKYYVELDYDADDGTEENKGKVAEVLLNIYDDKGNLVTKISPIKVKYPTTKVEIPFEKTDLPSETYTITVSPLNRDEEVLYTPSELELDYVVIVVPDTGGLFKNLNISKEDYLITGLLVFFVFGIVGIGIITRSDKNKSRRRK